MQRIFATSLALLLSPIPVSLGQDWSDVPMYHLSETRKVQKLILDTRLSDRVGVEGVFEVPQVFAEDIGPTEGCVYGEYEDGTIKELCPLGNTAFIVLYYVEGSALGNATHYRLTAYVEDLTPQNTDPTEDPFDGVEVDIASECWREGWELSNISDEGIVEYSQRAIVENDNGECLPGSEVVALKKYVLVMTDNEIEIATVVK